MKALPAPLLGSSDYGPRDNNISAITGLPAIVTHAGMTMEGLPLSIELLGRPFSESSLVGLARAVRAPCAALVRSRRPRPSPPGRSLPFLTRGSTHLRYPDPPDLLDPPDRPDLLVDFSLVSRTVCA